MTQEITENELNQILLRWQRYGNPSDIKNKAWKISEKLIKKISHMTMLIANFDKETAHTLGVQMGAIIVPPFLLCYYIGYELASGKMTRSDATLYLCAATESINTFVMEILAILVGNGITSFVTGQEMALEIAQLAGEVSSDICVLGIEDFKVVRFMGIKY